MPDSHTDPRSLVPFTASVLGAVLRKLATISPQSGLTVAGLMDDVEEHRQAFDMAHGAARQQVGAALQQLLLMGLAKEGPPGSGKGVFMGTDAARELYAVQPKLGDRDRGLAVAEYAPPGPSRRRLQLDLTPEEFEAMDRAMAARGTKTYAEVHRNAMKVYLWHIAQIEKGRQVYAREGERVIEVELLL
jgi:hypothetical protein